MRVHRWQAAEAGTEWPRRVGRLIAQHCVPTQVDHQHRPLGPVNAQLGCAFSRTRQWMARRSGRGSWQQAS
jgi:hypothetical protein